MRCKDLVIDRGNLIVFPESSGVVRLAWHQVVAKAYIENHQ